MQQSEAESTHMVKEREAASTHSKSEVSALTDCRRVKTDKELSDSYRGGAYLSFMAAVIRDTKVSMSIDASTAACRSKIGRKNACSSGESAANSACQIFWSQR